MACSTKEEVPQGVLGEEKLVDLIVDVELNQALYKLKFANKDSIDYNQMVEQTFSQHKTTKEQFNTSIAYYAKFPKTMRKIYNLSIVKLSQEQAKNQRKVKK
jgi:hypothetical protein